MKISLVNKLAFAGAVIAALSAVPMAQAATSTYNITTTWYEPDTQPKNTIFNGTFTFDSVTHTVTNLQGLLSESMTGTSIGDMTWLNLGYQLYSKYDAGLGGTFAAAFKSNGTSTFMGGTWMPEAGIDVGGVFAGGPSQKNYAASPKNAYALIFVPDNPLAALTQAQINKLAYADCAPGGMMGATCMTGTSEAGYGSVGTMSGYPLSQTITAVAAPVPEPESYALLLAGLSLMGAVARRRRTR